MQKWTAPHNSFTAKLLSIPVKTARSVATLSLTQSVELMRKAKEMAPDLWDALVKVALGRFFADAELEYLPLLEAWCAAKEITLPTHSILAPQSPLPAIILPRTISLIVDDLERALSDFLPNSEEIRKLYEELNLSLKEIPGQLPHAKLFAIEVQMFRLIG